MPSLSDLLKKAPQAVKDKYKIKIREKEEKKIIKKQGWKWVRRLALASLGIGFIPGL